MALGGLADERFIFLGALLRGPVSRVDLLTLFNTEYEWDLNDVSISALALRIENDGLIFRTDIDGRRHYGITREGFLAWRTRYDYFAKQTARWANERRTLKPEAFSGPPKKEKKLPKLSRLPNASEARLILKHSRPEFAALYEAAIESEVNVFDLAAVRIEDIDWEDGFVGLPAKAITGKPIKSTGVRMTRRLHAILKSVVLDRDEGPAFLSPRGEPWDYTAVSTQFRAAKQAAGVAKEIVLSGRGRHAT